MVLSTYELFVCMCVLLEIKQRNSYVLGRYPACALHPRPRLVVVYKDWSFVPVLYLSLALFTKYGISAAYLSLSYLIK